MILLDTNILSEAMRAVPDTRVVTWLDQQLVSHLYISSITQAEIEYGIAILPVGKRKKNLLAAGEKLLAKFSTRCLPFGSSEASVYAGIRADARKNGQTITTEDGQIAAIALSHKFMLATRNVKDFAEISGLAIINPFEG